MDEMQINSTVENILLQHWE